MGRMVLKTGLSILLGAGMVYLAFRGEDWGAFRAGIGAVDWTLLAAYLGLFGAAHVLRILRWGILVRALGPLSWRKVGSIGAFGYLCITALPLRLGEFVRPVLVRGEGGITASGALATVVVERVIDGILFVGLFFVFISLLPPTGDPTVEVVKVGAYGAGIFFGGLLIVLTAAYVKREATVRLLTAIGNTIHAGLTTKAIGLLEAFLDGLKVLPDRKRLAGFLGITAIYWVLQGVGIKVMAEACQIHDMTWIGGFALLTVLVVGIMVPAGPGFTGSFELAVKASFALLVLSDESRAMIVVFTIVLHVAQVGVQMLFGWLVLLTGEVDFAKLRQAKSSEDDAAQA
jgi:uncharacterized protein (TIRG00374 family)